MTTDKSALKYKLIGTALHPCCAYCCLFPASQAPDVSSCWIGLAVPLPVLVPGPLVLARKAQHIPPHYCACLLLLRADCQAQPDLANMNKAILCVAVLALLCTGKHTTSVWHLSSGKVVWVLCCEQGWQGAAVVPAALSDFRAEQLPCDSPAGVSLFTLLV